jgi:hypothetical protein
MDRTHRDVCDQGKLSLIHALATACLADASSDSLGCRLLRGHLRDRADCTSFRRFCSEYVRSCRFPCMAASRRVICVIAQTKGAEPQLAAVASQGNSGCPPIVRYRFAWPIPGSFVPVRPPSQTKASGRLVQVGFPKPFFGVLRSVCGQDLRRVPAWMAALASLARPSAQTRARLMLIRRRGGSSGAPEASTKEKSQDAPLRYTPAQRVSRRAVSSSDAKLTHDGRGLSIASRAALRPRRGTRLVRLSRVSGPSRVIDQRDSQHPRQPSEHSDRATW